ncbi:unnamed protein product [Effrenium voratum]|uniref:Uncharacterized protein n=1 Tax=Effrenium voratum TaxID=2562239 RepID=A0AA36I3N6_9DINO|nr:unnamed protein product [Effrenium voratum]
MFDDQRFMSHIVHLDMVALPAARQLGGGLVKYELHDAGPESRGLVVLFHGKQRNLREGARPLVEAYCRLKLSVCVIDYRQRFSQFCVDASVVLEELLGQQESCRCCCTVRAAGGSTRCTWPSPVTPTPRRWQGV